MDIFATSKIGQPIWPIRQPFFALSDPALKNNFFYAHYYSSIRMSTLRGISSHNRHTVCDHTVILPD